MLGLNCFFKVGLLLFLTRNAYAQETVTCDAGHRGPGGTCRCDLKEGFKLEDWGTPFCNEGGCYMAQDLAECQDKPNGYELGGGTVCWGGDRVTQCPTDQPLSSTPIFCPAGKRGAGGICDCGQNDAVNEEGTKWKRPHCYEGVCYTRQTSGIGFDACNGKGRGYQGPIERNHLTWCFNDFRDTKCP